MGYALALYLAIAAFVFASIVLSGLGQRGIFGDAVVNALLWPLSLLFGVLINLADFLDR